MYLPVNPICMYLPVNPICTGPGMHETNRNAPRARSQATHNCDNLQKLQQPCKNGTTIYRGTSLTARRSTSCKTQQRKRLHGGRGGRSCAQPYMLTNATNCLSVRCCSLQSVGSIFWLSCQASRVESLGDTCCQRLLAHTPELQHSTRTHSVPQKSEVRRSRARTIVGDTPRARVRVRQQDGANCEAVYGWVG